MSSINYEKMGYGNNLGLTIILHQLHVSCPTRNGCKAKGELKVSIYNMLTWCILHIWFFFLSKLKFVILIINMFSYLKSFSFNVEVINFTCVSYFYLGLTMLWTKIIDPQNVLIKKKFYNTWSSIPFFVDEESI